MCYQYKYDGRGRLVEKKLPGKGWESMVYDKADRLILTQDAVMKPQNKWLMTKYDAWGRIAYTGTFSSTDSRSTIQNQIADLVIYDVRHPTGIARNGITLYYTNVYFSVETLLSVNYYDTYPQQYSFNPPFPTEILGQAVLTDTPDAEGLSTKSLPVVSFVKNIEDDNWTKNYTYYDKKGRAIGSYSINHLGGYTKAESKLDFAGVVLNANTYHLRKQGEVGVTVKERFVYDSGNRLTQHYHQVDSKPEILLTENSYNELSQLTNKKVGNNLQSIDYAYNIRGWMTDINKDQMAMPDLGGKLFSYKIKYNEKQGIDNPDPALFSGKNVVPKFNGNIAEVDWRTKEENSSTTPKRYGYVYDKLNRLTAGYYQNPVNPYSKENIESLTYDANGNIASLYRTSVLQGTIATKIDDIEYTYAGNQAIKIKDNSTNPTGYEGTVGYPISYNLNGNMEKMDDKNITAIGYNHLNLPNSITIGSGQISTDISTKYGAAGTKLRKENYTMAVGVASTTWSKEITDYLDGFQYLNATNSGGIGGGGGGGSEMFSTTPMETKYALEMEAFSRLSPSDPIDLIPVDLPNPELQFFPTAEGFYDYQKNQYIYQYKDHLGNVRVSFARNSIGALEITDKNDYYPFGMNHMKTGNAYFGAGKYQNYKYNGKELQETGMYDYGARMYMNDVVIWGAHDPLAEVSRRFSPYAYAFNNPIRYIDPDGRSGKDWFTNSLGQMEFRDDVKSQQDLTDKGIQGTYVGESDKQGDTTYASNGYVYDDSASGGGKAIANGRITDIEDVTLYSAGAIAQQNTNAARSRLYEAIADYWGGYAYGMSVGYTWGNSGYTLSLFQNFGTGQAKLFGTASTGLVKASYGVNFQLNALSAYGKNPDGSPNKDVFGGALGSSTEVSGSYIFGGAVSTSTEDGSLLPSPKGTIGTSINLGPSIGGGTSKTYTTDLTPSLNRFLKFNWVQHKPQFD